MSSKKSTNKSKGSPSEDPSKPGSSTKEEPVSDTLDDEIVFEVSRIDSLLILLISPEEDVVIRVRNNVFARFAFILNKCCSLWIYC